MKGTIKTVHFGKGATFPETEIDSDTLLSVDFTGDDGGRVSVMIRRGVVTISTLNGRLLVLPEAANSIQIKTEQL
jgi:hypothetical protein